MLLRGSRTQKLAISKEGHLTKYYKYGGSGVESLFVQKIVAELKPRGTAFIILPDGIFERDADKTIRNMLLDKCIINGLVSLPTDAFYALLQKRRSFSA